MAVCSKCAVDKSEEQFHWDRRRVRRRPQCKVCHAVHQKEHKDRNKRKRESGELTVPTNKVCTICKEDKLIDQFCVATGSLTGHATACRDCRSDANDEYVSTFNGYLNRLLSSSKISAKKRKKRKRRSDNSGHHTLTLEDIKTMWENQQGCCFYSGIPMVHKAHADWRCSLERLDNSEGYTAENCVLICLEYQAAYTQWSREKVKYAAAFCK